MPICSDITKPTIKSSGSQLIKDSKIPKCMRHRKVSFDNLLIEIRWYGLLHERLASS